MTDPVRLDFPPDSDGSRALADLGERASLLKQAQQAAEFLARYSVDLASSEFNRAVASVRAEAVLHAVSKGLNPLQYQIRLASGASGFAVELVPVPAAPAPIPPGAIRRAERRRANRSGGKAREGASFDELKN